MKERKRKRTITERSSEETGRLIEGEELYKRVQSAFRLDKTWLSLSLRPKGGRKTIESDLTREATRKKITGEQL